MRNIHTQKLLDHWRYERGETLAPRKASIEPKAIKGQCNDTDQPTTALIKDLKQRGMLEDTLVVWTTEFGRMPSSQGGKGRDHNPYGFTMWAAGGGFKQTLVDGFRHDDGVVDQHARAQRQVRRHEAAGGDGDQQGQRIRQQVRP